MQAASARFFSSSASSKKVFSGISHAVARSSYRPLCWKTHEASLSAEDTPKVQKRVSKQERRARVEEFVKNYRSSHEGKFPSATSVRQQVGGSYYILWALLQELEYNSKLKNDVRDTSFNSWNCEGKYRFNNIDLSTKDVRTEEETDLPEVQNRVTKQERRTRVEEFVENYRASHDGKFPRATHVRQQVGGSYYIARALLQELEYNSRQKSDVRNASFNSENVKGKYGLDNTDHFTRDTITSFEGINKEMTKTSEPLDLKIKPELSDGKTGAAKSNLSSKIYLEDKSEPMASDHIESNKPIKAENLRRYCFHFIRQYQQLIYK
uniref:Uncharacterized protein n=1 Tax=Avena sativa TaxID=4498 RepID=A0ACD5V3A8_AVESA